uniref:Fanconi Anaemia group E protein C-terminal domain-containing protein n=1 Tax=Neolamprologus brichardi TaxID=32507 RepID=A0A3Q4MLW8_NEOBR
VEVLCSMLNLPGLPDQALPKLCSSVLALSPDLSYSTAATLIKSLLLEKVLSLSEPASRCLVTAVTSLCSRYPRPVCQALIGPVLEKENIGEMKGKRFTESDYRNDLMMSFMRVCDLGQMLRWYGNRRVTEQQSRHGFRALV